MAKTIQEWLPETKELEKKSRDDRDHIYFFKDPARPQYIDSEIFFSPADGIIMYAKEVHSPKEKLLDTKGVNFSVQDLLQDKSWDQPCLIVSIFMTQYDIHINRVPLAGLLRYKKLDSMVTKNLPMLAAESALLKGVLDPSIPGFLKKNEKVLNTVYSTVHNFKYYVLQIGDSDIDTIVTFNTSQNVKYQQNQRFGMIRWGSTTDLIIPLNDKYDFEILCKPMTHVEAGVDKLVRIHCK